VRSAGKGGERILRKRVIKKWGTVYDSEGVAERGITKTQTMECVIQNSVCQKNYGENVRKGVLKRAKE